MGHGEVLLQAKMIGPVEIRANQTRENEGQILGLKLHGQTRMMKMSLKISRLQLRNGRLVATAPRLCPVDGLVTKMKTRPMIHQSSCQIFLQGSPALNATWFRLLSRETLKVSGLPTTFAHNGQRRTKVSSKPPTGRTTSKRTPTTVKSSP